MDLNAPLGLNPPPKRRSKGLLAIAACAVVVISAGAALGVYFYEADPRGGEPFAVALVPPAPKAAVDSNGPTGADPMPTGSIAAPAVPDGVLVEHGVKIVSPPLIDTPTLRAPGPLVIDVSKALDGVARKTTMGGGGKANGSSRASSMVATRPRIALVVGALGLSSAATTAAIDTMPAAVSLAFVANGSTAAASVDTAKAKGHEILLQLPMQSKAEMKVGPHTIRAEESATDMARDLQWLAGRIDGYVGVVNLLGAPVTSNQAAMTAILRAVAQRGAFYLDDGTSRQSVATQIGTDLGTPTAQTDVVLDATADPAAVQANFERLMSIARTKGRAIGMASGLSDHLAAVARFAAALDEKGFALVPVSSVARSGGNLATAR